MGDSYIARPERISSQLLRLWDWEGEVGGGMPPSVRER